MRKVLFATGLGAMAAFAAGSAGANDQLIRMSQNPAEWAMPTGDYANTRYSKLKQINASNVGKLQVAWTFSTGVLRGHEGGPLIIDNMMYVHTPFPNKVYALDLSKDNKIVWSYEPKQDPNVIPVMCCDTVNRGLALCRRQDLPASSRRQARGAQCEERQCRVDRDQRRSEQRANRNLGADGRQGQGSGRHVRRRVRRPVQHDRLQHQGRQAGLERLLRRPGRPDPGRSRQDHRTRQADRQGFEPEDLGRRSVEDRRRLHVGLARLRSVARPRLLRLGQSFDLESEAAPRRQQVVDDDLGAQPGYRHGEVGLSDDAARRVGL